VSGPRRPLPVPVETRIGSRARIVVTVHPQVALPGGETTSTELDPDGELWILNLSTKGWGPGEYRLEIRRGDGEVYEVPLLLWN